MVPKLEPEGVDLLSLMLRGCPSERIQARDALKHQYFHDIEEQMHDLAGAPIL